MKIIKKENEQIVPSIFPFRTECEYCNTELELDESDVHIGSYGLYDYICPCCKMKNTIDDGIDLTKDNLQFPIHYYSFKDGKDIPDEKKNKVQKKQKNNKYSIT